jgi:transposase-like protein
MARGRPADSCMIVAHLTGSPSARQRLNLMLQTLKGDVPIPQAAAKLGVGRSRFCLKRQEMLQAALASLEPKPRGRPPLETTPEQQEIERLQQQVQALKIDLKAAQIREELALLMPHVLIRNRMRRKKNASPSPRRRGPGGSAAG